MQKILIVDDEESICEILQFNLEIEGYEADVAYSAEQALKMDLKSYSLILLDIMMGGMSGPRGGRLYLQAVLRAGSGGQGQECAASLYAAAPGSGTSAADPAPD